MMHAANHVNKVMQPTLRLTVQYADTQHQALLPRPLLRRWARATLETNLSVTLRFVDQEEGRALNRDYRHKDYATNVLTFAYDAVAEDALGTLPDTASQLMADIVICCPVIEAEAKAQHKPLLAHYAHMLVHGMLHAQGYDHEDHDEALIMEQRETYLLSKLGFADPYQDEIETDHQP